MAELDARTGASMKLRVLNPHGRIWTMSAGGGASVVYADTVCQMAAASGAVDCDLANYGEYSGAPTEAQTYEYASTILRLMTTASHPHPKGEFLFKNHMLLKNHLITQTIALNFREGVTHWWRSC